MLEQLRELSLTELEELVHDAKKQLEIRQKQEIRNVYMECKRLAGSVGLSLDELIEKVREPDIKKSNRPVAPRYRCPESGATWTGQGRTPIWLVAKLAAGASKDDFRIQVE